MAQARKGRREGNGGARGGGEEERRVGEEGATVKVHQDVGELEAEVDVGVALDQTDELGEETARDHPVGWGREAGREIGLKPEWWGRSYER